MKQPDGAASLLSACPSATNEYLAGHIHLLSRSLFALTGHRLTESEPALTVDAERIFHAPFAVLSHNTDSDPVLTYANRIAMQLFELDWDTLIRTPSRMTAEVPLREERERLLRQVSERGFIDDYSGIRISRSGRRFRIEQAIVWNLTDEAGQYRGQAAMFHHWTFLQV